MSRYVRIVTTQLGIRLLEYCMQYAAATAGSTTWYVTSHLRPAPRSKVAEHCAADDRHGAQLPGKTAGSLATPRSPYRVLASCMRTGVPP